MRQLPRTIKLLGQVIPVTSVAKLTVEDVGECYGAYDPGVPRISIDRASGNERKRATLVHECMHAMFNAGQLASQPADDEEELVSRLSPILLSWMRENRLTIEYLLESGT
jgi:Zn-dependent peptidase ImmA (M78 family)